MLNLGDLATMVVVVNEGTLQLAAEKLHKTQPAISQAIKRLEETIDLKLFDRSGHRFVLTESGRAFYERATELLNQSTQLQHYASLLAAGQEKSYRICVHAIIPESYYEPPVSQAAGQYPMTNLYTLCGSFNMPLSQLDAGRVDLAIVCGHDASPILQQYQRLRLGELVTVNVMRTSLLRELKEGADSIPGFGGIRRLVVDTPAELDPFDFRRAQQGPYWSISDMATQLRLIRAGQGWGQVPLSCVQQELQQGTLHMVPQAPFDQIMTLSVWALRKADRPVGLMGECLWQQLKITAANT